MVKQLNSGSEATEAALKMARQYHRQSGSPERYKTISFYHSYHGATMGALTATGWPQLRTPYEPFLSGGIHAHPPIPSSCRACAGNCTLGCLEQMRDVVEHEGPGTVSAIIVEPVMLTAGVQPLSAEYLRGLRALCDETGVLLVFDEIVTGSVGSEAGSPPSRPRSGRTSSASARACRAVTHRSPRYFLKKVASAFWGEAAAGVQYQAGHTFAGNPVSAAVGLAVIRYFEQHRVLENVLARGAELESRLARSPTATRSAVRCAAAGSSTASISSIRRRAARSLPRSHSALRSSRPPGSAGSSSGLRSTTRRWRRRSSLGRDVVEEIADLFEESVAAVSDRVATGKGVKLDVAFGL